MGQTGEGAEDGRRALAMARELGYPAGEAAALEALGWAAFDFGDYDEGRNWQRQGSRSRRPSPRSPGGAAPPGHLR